MSQKRTRKQGKSRSSATKKPELRASGRAARVAERRKARPAATVAGLPINIRPNSPGGLVTVLGFGFAAVAAFAVVMWLLNRWWVLAQPDSLWWMISLGAIGAAPAVGYVARNNAVADSVDGRARGDRTDVLTWVWWSTGVATIAFLVEHVASYPCQNAWQCTATGARGSFTVPGSLAVIAVCAAVTWFVGNFLYRMSAKGRPPKGRETKAIALRAMTLIWLGVGVPILALLLIVDLYARTEPQRANRAISVAEQKCFGLLDTPPNLVARPYGQIVSNQWSTYLVRRANETRKDVGKKKPEWKGEPNMYEAVIAVAGRDDSTPSAVHCRLLDEGTATKADYKAGFADPKSSPLRPQDLLQQPTTPAQ